uniref:Vomeronasal type-1 receptor n=1 Tax=Ornithorhynchus anatinus TaxID=9258 RepID=A0A6I8N141_ORNAN
MTLNNFLLGIFFLSQFGIGVLGNSVLFLVYVNVFIYQPSKKKPTDLILINLTLVNMAMLVICGVQVILVNFGMKYVLDDVGCRGVLYINRVARGLSICTTCLLSVFQAVTISPSTSCWARLKPRAPSYILPSLLFFWILNLMLYIGIITSVEATKNVTLPGHTFISKGCSTVPGFNYAIVVITLVTFRDLFFVFLMSWASGYMVIVLYRHRKQVQHIHSTNVSPRSSVESRVIQTNLFLVNCFVFFYWLNCCITLYISYIKDYDSPLQYSTTFLAACFPSLCPWVLIRNDARVPRPQFVFKKLGSSTP